MELIEYKNGETIGKILLISLDNYIIGITGYYFKNMNFVQLEKEAKIYEKMPTIKCYRLVKNLY